MSTHLASTPSALQTSAKAAWGDLPPCNTSALIVPALFPVLPSDGGGDGFASHALTAAGSCPHASGMPAAVTEDRCPVAAAAGRLAFELEGPTACKAVVTLGRKLVTAALAVMRLWSAAERTRAELGVCKQDPPPLGALAPFRVPSQYLDHLPFLPLPPFPFPPLGWCCDGPFPLHGPPGPSAPWCGERHLRHWCMRFLFCGQWCPRDASPQAPVWKSSQSLKPVLS